jgi:hypothetical protein
MNRLALIFICLFLISKGWALETVKQDLRKISIQDSFDLTIDVASLFVPAIIELEQENIGFFGKCKVFSDPLTPEKLGIKWEEYGIIDPIKQAYLESLAKSYGSAGYVVDEEKLIEYANCLKDYGVFIARAVMNFRGSLKQSGKIKLEELKALLEKSTKKQARNKTINQIARMEVKGPCKLASGGFLCGGFFIKLDPPQELRLQNLTVFGQTFLGTNAAIRLTKAAGSEYTSYYFVPNTK